MLKISKMADYATLIMSFFVNHSSALCSATTVAEGADLPQATVSKILKQLSESGLVVSERGPAGGYRLARPADQINLIDVIIAIDGLPAITECGLGAKTCVKNNSCLIKHNWQMVNGYIVKILRSLTLSDMTSSLSSHPLFAGDKSS